MIVAEVSLHFGVCSLAVLWVLFPVLRVSSLEHIDLWVIEPWVVGVIDFTIHTSQNGVQRGSSAL